MQQYLGRMVAAMAVLGGREQCRALGLDQGFHNYLYYTGAFHDDYHHHQQQQGEGAAAEGGEGGQGRGGRRTIAIREAGRSQVHTIGRFCSGPQGHEVNHTLIADRQQGFMVLNQPHRGQQQQPAPVVHQIDRCKAPYYDQAVHEAFLLRDRCPQGLASAILRAQGRTWEALTSDS